MANFLKTCLLYIRILLDKTIDFLFSLYWESKKQSIPPLEKNRAYLKDSAMTLAAKIRNKMLKSEELVEAVIERIKKVNPILNAVVEGRYEEALAEAREVDKLIEKGLTEEQAKQKPFLGVPFTTKESQAIKGFHLTMGLWSRRYLKAEEDSEAVIRLRAAGAIPLAATNLPELLVWHESRNPVYGMTKNPHHTGRTPGGSSGGEGALMATCGTTISLCSDLGGSTRMPAFFNGLFGLHPTANVTNVKGSFFRSGEEDSMFSLGFMSRHVEDLGPLISIVSGEKASTLKLDRSVDIKNLKYYYTESCDDIHLSAMGSELRDAMKRIVANIGRNSNCSPQPYYHKGFNHMVNLWRYWMTKEPGNFPLLYNNGTSEACAMKELIKKVLGMSKHCFFSVIRLIEHQWLPKVNSKWAEELTNELKNDLFSKLGDDGVLLFPSSPATAPYHYSILLRPFNFAYWGIVNVLKCPSVQVPLGVDSKGLPLGIQVVAAPYNEALCLAVAKYLEQQFGGAILACQIID